MTNPAAIKRRLTGEETHLLQLLATAVVAQQSRCTASTAAQVLDRLAGEGEVLIQSDAIDARLTVSGKTLVHTTREWLAFHAEHPEAINFTRHCHTIRDDEETAE